MFRKLFKKSTTKPKSLKDFLDCKFEDELVRPEQVNLFSYFAIEIPSRIN